MARVLFVTTSYPAYSGDPAGHFVETEARARARAGDDVVVVAPGRPPETPARTHPTHADGIDVRWLPGGDAFGWPGALARLRERPLRALGALTFVRAARRGVVDLGAFDQVVAHWLLPSAWPIAVAARRAGRAGSTPELEVVAHGSDVRLVERLPRRVRTALAAELLDAGARFRFVSRELEARFARATTTEVLTRSRVEPSPIDVSFVPARAEARAQLGLGQERIAVVAGRLIATKQPVRAVRLASTKADRVVVLGDGPLADEVRHACPEALLCGKLSRPDALSWIAAADLLVSASTEEGAPTVVREARALGVPVLAVPAGDLAERALTDAGITLVER